MVKATTKGVRRAMKEARAWVVKLVVVVVRGMPPKWRMKTLPMRRKRRTTSGKVAVWLPLEISKAGGRRKILADSLGQALTHYM